LLRVPFRDLPGGPLDRAGETSRKIGRAGDPADGERYYREMAIVAQLFGTAPVIPRTLTDFREYVASEFAGTTVSVTEPAREVADVQWDRRLSS